MVGCSESRPNEPEVADSARKSTALPGPEQFADALELLKKGAKWPGLIGSATTSEELQILSWYDAVSAHVTANLEREAAASAETLARYIDTGAFQDTVIAASESLEKRHKGLGDVPLFTDGMLLMERASRLSLDGETLFHQVERTVRPYFLGVGISAASLPVWLCPKGRYGAGGQAAVPRPVTTIEEVNQILAALAAQEKIEKGDIQAMALRLRALQRFPKFQPLAVALAQGFATILEKNQSYAAGAEEFRALARRINLPGNSMVIAGTRLDNGQPFDTSSLAGKVVIVDIWASWCGPCVQALPHLRELYETYHNKGLEIVGISEDQSRRSLREFLAQRADKGAALLWTMLYDGPETDDEPRPLSPTVNYYRPEGIPFMVIIGRDGKVARIFSGGVKPEVVDATIQPLLAAPAN